MGNSLRERDVFSKRTGENIRKKEQFFIEPLSQEHIASLQEGEWSVRAIVVSEKRTLLVCPAVYTISGTQYRWIEIPLGGKTTFHDKLDKPDDVFSRAPVEVRIAAVVTQPQKISF